MLLGACKECDNTRLADLLASVLVQGGYHALMPGIGFRTLCTNLPVPAPALKRVEEICKKSVCESENVIFTL